MKNRPLQKDLFFSKTGEYLNHYLPNQVHKSPKTIKTYRDALTVFRRYLLEKRGISIKDFRFEDCTHELLLDYLAFLSESGHKPTSCNNRMAAVKSYLWYAADDDISIQGIALAASRVKRIREPKINRPIIEEDAFNALLTAPPPTKLGIRDRTIMILLYDTAIRVSELIDLNVDSVNLKASPPYIHVHGKGDKERIVVMTDRTAGHLNKYNGLYHLGEYATHDMPLFYTVIRGHTGRMSPGNVERIINKYAAKIRPEHPDLSEHVHPHMFRRTRATNLYQDGVDLELVSRILGHSSTITTRIYATPSVEMMRRAMESKADGSQTEEKLWSDDEEELAKICGLR